MLRTETKYIVIHCSATPPDMDVGLREIRRWHLDRGFNDVGYSDIIRRNGELELGRAANEIGAHVKGYNSISVGICLVGGVDKKLQQQDNFTEEQMKTLKRSIMFYKTLIKKAKVIAHRDLDKKKDCPCFDVKAFCKENNFEYGR